MVLVVDSGRQEAELESRQSLVVSGTHIPGKLQRIGTLQKKGVKRTSYLITFQSQVTPPNHLRVGLLHRHRCPIYTIG